MRDFITSIKTTMTLKIEDPGGHNNAYNIFMWNLSYGQVLQRF